LRGGRHLAAGGLLLLMGLGALAACAPGPRIAVPADLPNTTHEQSFELRWALQREAGAARAIGWVRTLANQEAQLTLALFGLDAGGRIVSRGTTVVRFRFTRDPEPFVVELRPTGREATFQLRILELMLPGFRTN
jgi:hypothetical protein